jgi:ATP-dependent Clp protease ATP-binding subunit ClpA
MTTSNDDADSLFLTDGTICPELLSEGLPAVLQAAVSQAVDTNWASVTVPHLFMGLLAVPDAGVCKWGERLQADLSELLRQFQELFHQEGSSQPAIGGFSRPYLTEQVIRLLVEARARATARGRISLTPLDLLSAVFTTKTIVAECFERIGVSAERMVELVTLAEREAGE